MLVGRCIALLLTLSSMGCVAFQDSGYSTAQKCRAHTAWWSKRSERCSSNPLSHYSRGWRHGYSDVLMGGDGNCPPVPPQCYWSSKYQSERGDAAIESWFAGYRDGSTAAIASCQNSYHPIPVSGESQQYCPGCLPSDRSPYPIGRTTIGISTRPDGSPDPIEDSEPPAPEGEVNHRKDSRIRHINHDDSTRKDASTDQGDSTENSGSPDELFEIPPSPSQDADDLGAPCNQPQSRPQKKWSAPASFANSITNAMAQVFRQE